MEKIKSTIIELYQEKLFLSENENIDNPEMIFEFKNGDLISIKFDHGDKELMPYLRKIEIKFENEVLMKQFMELLKKGIKEFKL